MPPGWISPEGKFFPLGEKNHEDIAKTTFGENTLALIEQGFVAVMGSLQGFSKTCIAFSSELTAHQQKQLAKVEYIRIS